MSEFAMRDLFDRWERVWHEGQYDLVPGGVAENYIRHDEGGDRTVTREAYAAEIAKVRTERPVFGWSCTITRSKVTARGFAFLSTGLIRRRASRVAGLACNRTGLRPANSLKLG